MRLIAFKSALMVILVASAPVQADLVQEFKTDGTDPNASSPSGDSLLVTYSLVDMSVTFDATLSVVGSGNLTTSSSGTGVTGGNGGDSIGNGESIVFSMTIDNVLGGSVTFDGFTTIDLASFTTSSGTPEEATLTWNGGANSLALTGPTADPVFTSPLPQILTVIGGDPSSFRIDDISASFTIVAIPEPSAFLFGGLVCGVVGMNYTRKQRKSRD